MSPLLFALLAAIAAAGLSMVLIRLATRILRKGFQDAANERSLHDGIIPKVGGLGLFGAVFIVLILAQTLSAGPAASTSSSAWLWLACASFIFFICVLNDRAGRDLPPLLRLAAHSLAACLLCLQAFALLKAGTDGVPALLAPRWIWASAAIISVIAFTNLFNFMDGMDGLAGSMGLLGFATLALAALLQGGALAPQMTVIGLVLSGACAGFLRWNWPRASVFMGDTGSTFLGFSAAGLGWLGALAGLWHWSLPFIAFFPFWFDASLTLLRRLLRGEAIWRAHREHFYQRAVLSLRQAPDAHLKVLRPALLLMLCSAAAALWMQTGSSPGMPAGGAMAQDRALAAATLLLLLHGLVALSIERRLRRSGALDQVARQALPGSTPRQGSQDHRSN